MNDDDVAKSLAEMHELIEQMKDPSPGSVKQYTGRRIFDELTINTDARPGDFVGHQDDRNSLGVVVSVADRSVNVLWSAIDPKKLTEARMRRGEVEALFGNSGIEPAYGTTYTRRVRI